MKNFLKKLLSLFKLKVVRMQTWRNFISNASYVRDLEFLKIADAGKERTVLDLLHLSKSQIRQDLFVLLQLDFKREGFFVEFGATDGFHFSNSHILEKHFAWDGLLVEPARGWHKQLKSNRKCKIDNRCVWSHSGQKIKFNEAIIGSRSTIDELTLTDKHMRQHIREGRRKTKDVYFVETVSLNDLLAEHGAAYEIDYLSIDTEGSELEILQAFDFSKHQIKIITCEHNYTENREKIFKLLSSFGYERVYQNLSRFDDWFILS